MKFSPTITLALALAAGMTGAALAQTTAPQGMAQPDAAQTAAPAGQPGLQPDQPATTQPQAQQGMQPQPGTQPQALTGMQTEPGMSAQPDTRSGAGQAAMQPSQGMMTPGVQRSEQVRQVQERLSTLGLYKGPSDGQMDPDTRAAIANFQQQNGIRRTANLDQRTLDRLLTGQTSGSGSSTPPRAQGTSGTLGSGPSPIGAGR
jgi:peptidoglycan hydrolase-like protein with peptidoglycan-binding domain